MRYDVAILGGGPAGSTAGCLLTKYSPDLRVAIFEKERFPRDHVGESQLPACGFFLNEMGCWDKVEAADFPIKVGATYLWGKSSEPWDFEFLPLSQFPKDARRPSRYEGARRLTAFQVDRSIYDQILLDHAQELGCDVFQETQVTEVQHDGDTVTGLRLADGRAVEARYYIDATGHYGTLRRALGVPTDTPTSLMNIAIWDYWENADWAVEIGVGGTRVQVLSLPNGWCWFIPLGPTRTSIGFICPARYYKERAASPEELYAEAIQAQPRVRALTRNGTRTGKVRTTKDWSFVSERIVGPNWFLVGEAAGFADPILAGGLTLAHESARHAAYVILELDRGTHDPKWLREHYDRVNRTRVQQFIRFADYWYAANGQFREIQEFTAQIARDAGMTLTPQAAFRWLSLGGFNLSDGARPGIGGLDLGAVKEVASIFTANTDAKPSWELNKYNTLRLNLAGAELVQVPMLVDGRIEPRDCYQRGTKMLPRTGVFGHCLEVLEHESDLLTIAKKLDARCQLYRAFHIHDVMSTLETLVIDGWVAGKLNKKKQRFWYDPDGGSTPSNFHANSDVIPGASPGV
jgi:flavin-dependent dehydrogenase